MIFTNSAFSSAGKAGKRKAGIKAGEEILVSYGKGFWEARRTLVSEQADKPD